MGEKAVCMSLKPTTMRLVTMTLVSHLIFDADSESVVRFEIGAREVLQKAVFVDRKCYLTPLWTRRNFFLFFS